MEKPKHKYRGGRPKGVKNGESGVSKGRLWETEEEKAECWKRAEEKITKQKITNETSSQRQYAKINNHYKEWYVDISLEDYSQMTHEEIDRLVYDYKGQKHLFDRKTKEEGYRYFDKK